MRNSLWSRHLSLGWLAVGLAVIALAAPAGADARTRHKARKPAAAKTVAAPLPASPGQAGLVLATEPGLLPDMVLGNPDAPVTVIEYASAACPHCAAWNRDTWPAFRDKYVTTGKIRYVFRELLTSPAEYALAGFLIGRCAVAKSKTPQDSRPYFSVVEAFFAGQEGYYKTGQMAPIGQEVTRRTGLSQMAQLDCVTDEKQVDAFYKTMNAHATADKVHSAPTFIVNGKTTEGHEMADLDAAIAAAAKP